MLFFTKRRLRTLILRGFSLLIVILLCMILSAPQLPRSFAAEDDSAASTENAEGMEELKPMIRSLAKDGSTGTGSGTLGEHEQAQVLIAATNLLQGESYTIAVTAMDADSETPKLDTHGNPICKSTTFTAECGLEEVAGQESLEVLEDTDEASDEDFEEETQSDDDAVDTDDMDDLEEPLEEPEDFQSTDPEEPLDVSETQRIVTYVNCSKLLTLQDIDTRSWEGTVVLYRCLLLHNDQVLAECTSNGIGYPKATVIETKPVEDSILEQESKLKDLEPSDSKENGRKKKPESSPKAPANKHSEVRAEEPKTEKSTSSANGTTASSKETSEPSSATATTAPDTGDGTVITKTLFLCISASLLLGLLHLRRWRRRRE